MLAAGALPDKHCSDNRRGECDCRELNRLVIERGGNRNCDEGLQKLHLSDAGDATHRQSRIPRKEAEELADQRSLGCPFVRTWCFHRWRCTPAAEQRLHRAGHLSS